MVRPRLELPEFDGNEEDLSAVLEGLDASGATLARIGEVLGGLVQGEAIGADGKKRIQRVDARTQAMAVKTALELRGLLTKRVALEGNIVHRHRATRAALGAGDLAGIDAATLKALPAPVRDRLIADLRESGATVLDADVIDARLIDGNGAVA